MLRRHRRRFHGPPLPSNAEDLLISVIVPAYDEEETVAESIRRIRSAPYRLEIVAVNDGSGDGTGAELDRLAGDGLVDTVMSP
jgi:CDP-glycerol glycerophosphotransferase